MDRTPFVVVIPFETAKDKADLPATVSARAEGHVVDPVAAALNVVDYEEATRMIARTAVRAVMKDRSSSDLVTAHAELDAAVLEAIGEAARSWGVVVSSATLDATSS